MKNLKGANIVKLYDVFFTKNNVYIMQELCNSGDLRHYLKLKKEPLTEKEALTILNDILMGF